MAEQTHLASKPSDAALAFNREDFAVLAADFRRQMHGRSDKLGALGALGLICRECGKPLVDTVANRGRSEAVLATGAFPSCAHVVFPST